MHVLHGRPSRLSSQRKPPAYSVCPASNRVQDAYQQYCYQHGPGRYPQGGLILRSAIGYRNVGCQRDYFIPETISLYDNGRTQPRWNNPTHQRSFAHSYQSTGRRIYRVNRSFAKRTGSGSSQSLVGIRSE